MGSCLSSDNTPERLQSQSNTMEATVSVRKSTFALQVREALSRPHDWVGVTAERLILEGSLAAPNLHLILKKSIAFLRSEPSLIELSECRVVGNLHSSIDNLLAIFRLYGWPSTTTYVFLGNYIDLDPQGKVQFSVLLMLLLFKIAHPKNILLLRGKSECEHCAAEVGLIDACFDQFSGAMYPEFALLFKYMPLAALAAGVYFLSCSSLSLTRGHLIDFEAEDRPRTTCVQACNPKASSAWSQRASVTTLPGLRYWEKEPEGKGHRNLRLFLKWNKLKAIVKTNELNSRSCPKVEGPNDSIISFHSATLINGQQVNGAIMAVHKNLVCTFHPVNLSRGHLDVRMIYPGPIPSTELTESSDLFETNEQPD